VTQRFFTSDYVEHAKLRDGTPVLLRLVTPEDKELLRREFDRWSDASRYARFHGPKTRLSEEELRYLTEIDQENHFALGAIREDGDGHGEPVGLGIARFIRLPDDEGTAEAAISVADHAQHKGLGRLLFMRLCAAAAERGIERFRCDVLGNSPTTKALIDAVAPDHVAEVADGVLSIEFAVPSVQPDVGHAAPPEGGLYRFFRQVAQGAIELARRLRT
jgi:acetyltransferase